MQLRTLMQMAVVLVCFGVGAESSAARIQLYKPETKSANSSVDALFKAIGKGLPEHDLAIKNRPSKWKDDVLQDAAVLSRQAQKDGNEYALDCVVSGSKKKKAMHVRFVDASGRVLHEGKLSLNKKSDSKVQKLAQGVVSAVHGAAEETPVASSAPVAQGREPEDPFATTNSATSTNAPVENNSNVVASETSSNPVGLTAPLKSSRKDPGAVFALRLGGGAHAYAYSVDTGNDATSYDANSGMAPQFGLGAEAQFLGFVVDVEGGRYVSKLRDNGANTTIQTTGLDGLALLGYGLQLGRINFGARAGSRYESISVDSNGATSLVPARTRLSALVGVAARYNPLSESGLSVDATLLFMPFGAQKIDPAPDAALSKLGGYQGQLRARYRFREMFNIAAPFVEIEGHYRLATARYAPTGGGTDLVESYRDLGSTLRIGFVL